MPLGTNGEQFLREVATAPQNLATPARLMGTQNAREALAACPARGSSNDVRHAGLSEIPSLRPR